MSNDSLRKADRIVERLLDLPESAHEALISSECEGDEAVESLVRRLLAQSSNNDGRFIPGGALRLLGVETADFRGDATRRLEPDERIGVFRIVRELGRGGMATVYLADRDDGQFEQTVAIKVLDRAGEYIARFEQERQILASLDHPNIAHLLDGGITERRHPYVAMEYIEGEPILDYCDRCRLDVAERLRLFLPVADAVDYAHRRLIVHRDIKSSNILVTEQGVPKLLDFGIAKLLGEQDLPHAAPVTRAAAPLTPEYASPEQIRGETMTVATDIYQLGYLLYVMLTGRSPYSLQSTGVASLVEAITRKPPIMPSARVAEVSAAEDVDADVYSARKTTPARLRKRLGGDLDRIVLKALHKDPAQRYSSAAELAADIENVLFDRPIMARRDSVVYRTSKFVRRHALAVVTGVITVIAVIAGSATFTYRLSQEKQTAETEATKAREVSTFLIDLVKLSEPERSQGRAVTVREVLDRAAGRIDVELAGQPQLQATLQNVIGQMYRELGEFARAEALLDQALETMAATGGRNRQGITDIHAQRSELFLYQSRYDEALAAIDNALDLLNQEPAPPADVLPDLLRIRGGALRLLGRHDEARVSLMEAQAALQRNPAPDSRLGAAIFLELGNVDHDASDFDSARQNFGEAINRLSGDGQPPTLDLSRAHMRIAWVFVELNQLAAAEEHARTALDIASSIHGSNHPDVLFPLGVLSSVQADRGEFDAAERSLDTQLQIARETLGSEHADTATIMNNMGTMKFRQGRYEDAAAWYRQAVAVRRTALGPEHPITGMTMSFEAYARYLSGDPSAENLYRDALAVLEAAYEPGHRYIANVHHDLGRIYVDRGQYEEAEPLLRSALEARQAIYGEDNVRVAATKLYLGACLSGRGELAEAGVLIEESRAWTVTAHGEGSDEVAHADLWKSDWLRRSGRDDEADRLLEEASSLIRAEKPADHWLRRIASRLEAQT